MKLQVFYILYIIYIHAYITKALQKLTKKQLDNKTNTCLYHCITISWTAGYSSTIKAIGNVLASLDVLTAFASVAVSANKPYVRPEMLPTEAGEFNLIQVRHPCLEIQEGVDFIANDISFKRGNF